MPQAIRPQPNITHHSLYLSVDALCQAGKRGAYGAASALQRWLLRGASDEQPSTSLPHPSSTFALYVNCAGVLWLFGYMILEVGRSWHMACDAPLHLFVLGAAILGVTLALADFIADVFRGARALARSLTLNLASRCRGARGRGRWSGSGGWPMDDTCARAAPHPVAA